MPTVLLMWWYLRLELKVNDACTKQLIEQIYLLAYLLTYLLTYRPTYLPAYLKVNDLCTKQLIEQTRMILPEARNDAKQVSDK